MLPNYVLVLGLPKTGKIKVAKALSKKNDLTLNEESHSGIIVKSQIATKYYSTEVNILVDEYPAKRNEKMDNTTKLLGLKDWTKEFISEEYHELREVLDGIIFTIDLDNTDLDYLKKTFEYLSEIKESLDVNDHQWEGFLVVAGITETDDEFDDIEDLVLDHGYEYLNMRKSGRNEYMERIGKDRLEEILESHEWRNISTEPNNRYEINKLNKANEMIQGLLPDKEADRKNTDLEDVLLKIQSMRNHAYNLQGDKKEEFVNNAVNEILDFL